MEIPLKQRINGFSYPLSLLQVFSSLIYLFDLLNFILQVLPHYSIDYKILLSMLYSALFLTLLYFYILLTYKNPTDPLIHIYHTSQSDE